MIKLINILNEMEIEDPGTGLTIENPGNHSTNNFRLYFNKKYIGNVKYIRGVLKFKPAYNLDSLLSNDPDTTADLFDENNIPYKLTGTNNTITLLPDTIDNWYEITGRLNEMEIEDPISSILYLKRTWWSQDDGLYLIYKDSERAERIGMGYLGDSGEWVRIFPTKEFIEYLDECGIPYEKATSFQLGIGLNNSNSIIIISTEYCEFI